MPVATAPKRYSARRYFSDCGLIPQAALQRWTDEKDKLLNGEVPRAKMEADKGKPILKDLCNQFLTEKTNLLNIGELSTHSFRDDTWVCEALIETFGRTRLLTDLLPEDFQKLGM